MPDKNERPVVRPGMGPGRGGGPMGPMNKEKPKNASGTLKRLLKYIGKSKYLFLSLLIIMLFTTLLSLLAPALQGVAIDTITLKEGDLSIDFKKFILMLFCLGMIYIFSSVFTYLQGICSAKLSQYTVKTMRRDLFGKIERLPISYIDRHSHGDIMSRMTNDVENVSNTISQSVMSLFSGALTILGTIVIMIYYSPLLTLVSFITLPLTLFLTSFMAKHMRKYFLRQQILLGEINGQAEEQITGFKTVVSYGKEKDAVWDFSKKSDELRTYGVKARVMGSIMGPIMNFIGNTGFILIAAAGGLLAWRGAITVGVIQAFLNYSKQFTRPINELANQYTQIMTALAGAERVFAVLDHPDEIDEGKIALENVKGDIEFKNIFFSYVKGEQVLKNFNLSVKHGQKIAIVGATGSGKTTLVNLLTRFYDADEGSITIDGADIKDISKNSLRQAIAVVLQDTVLFSDTIMENIKYGRQDASNDEAVRAAEISNANIFIERMKNGYDTVLDGNGGKLSQGQRQLISIARAVLADPKILILDEATSSVDTRTEMQIQEAMISLMKNRTSLIIAHRLSTIRDADLIVVIDNGEVAEMGNHEELLAKKGCYYMLYQNQFAGIKT